MFQTCRFIYQGGSCLSHGRGIEFLGPFSSSQPLVPAFWRWQVSWAHSSVFPLPPPPPPPVRAPSSDPLCEYLPREGNPAGDAPLLLHSLKVRKQGSLFLCLQVLPETHFCMLIGWRLGGLPILVRKFHFYFPFCLKKSMVIALWLFCCMITHW